MNHPNNIRTRQVVKGMNGTFIVDGFIRVDRKTFARVREVGEDHKPIGGPMRLPVESLRAIH